MKGYMKEHHPLTKLLAFKFIVGLVFLEKVCALVVDSELKELSLIKHRSSSLF